jgi:hypothetical protein
MKILLSIAFAAIMLSACKNPETRQEIPARIIEPTAESRAELLDVVSNALHNANLTLADDALTKSSLLVIERKRHRDLNNNPVMGRELGQPEQFRLLLSGDQCVLIHLNSANRSALKNARCIAE